MLFQGILYKVKARIHSHTSIFFGLLLATLAGSTYAQPVISSIQSHGKITWSNYLPNATYHLEWASTIEGPWHTSAPPFTIVSTSHIVTADIPRFYRVAWINPPDISYKAINEFANLISLTEFDLNDDSIIDFRIQRSLNSNGSISSENTTIQSYHITNTPFNAGDDIGPAIPWGSPNQSVSIGVRTPFIEYDGGPWAGVTNAYIPLGFLIGTNIHYGWINMALVEVPLIDGNTGEPTEATILNYSLIDAAWHKYPNTSLQAGQLE